jgi:hypothetical protein
MNFNAFEVGGIFDDDYRPNDLADFTGPIAGAYVRILVSKSFSRVTNL